MVIDLLEKQKIFYELASIVLKERYPGVRTAQKMKFSIEDFFSKYDQIRRNLRIWSHLLKKSLMENVIFYCCSGVFHLGLLENSVAKGLYLQECQMKKWLK